MTQLFANNAASELANAVTSGATSLTLKAGGGALFPTPAVDDFFLVTLYQKVGQDETNHEIVKCTARTGDVLTVVRAQEGTTARAFAVQTPVELRLTAGAIAAKQDGIPVISYEDRGTLRTNTTATHAIVDGLGLFVFEVGSTEPDDDESCFATATGRWLLEAAHWDVVDAWQAPDQEYSSEAITDMRADAALAQKGLEAAQESIASVSERWPGRVLYGTAASSITSVTSVSQVSFIGTVTGAAVGDRVLATPPNALGPSIAAYARVTGANTITVYLNNPSAAAQAIAAGVWNLSVFKES